LANTANRLTSPVAIGDFLGEDLDRHVTIEAGVTGSVHLTHPSSPKGLEDLVGAEACSA
jgi:hypothetical protein